MNKLKTHRPFMKFTAIKLVFIAIILNTLVLSRIVNTPAMPIPDGICPEEWREENVGACAVRYIYFIQIVEALGIFCLVLCESAKRGGEGARGRERERERGREREEGRGEGGQPAVALHH